MQNDLWTHRDETVGDIDLTSFKVEALDGDIGKIDEATYEAGRSFIVVDTGPWIFGKKVMLPAGVIDRIDTENERVVVGRTKDEITRISAARFTGNGIAAIGRASANSKHVVAIR